MTAPRENAIRHARGRVQISVLQPGDLVHLIVQDDGPGIDPQDADAIFEPGWQTSGGSGAGLGLALARRLATSAGRSVATEQVATGARMVLALPAIVMSTA